MAASLTFLGRNQKLANVDVQDKGDLLQVFEVGLCFIIADGGHRVCSLA